MGTLLCDVTLTFKRQEKNKNICFQKQDTIFFKTMYVGTFTKNAHGNTQRPTLNTQCTVNGVCKNTNL